MLPNTFLYGMTNILQDVPFIGAVLIATAVAVLTGSMVLTEMKSATNSTQMDQEVLQEGLDAYKVFDLGLVGFNVFFWIVGIVLALMTRSHPVFAIPSFFVLAISGFVSMQLSNMYAAIVNTSAFSGVANSFPALNAFMGQYGTVVLVMGAVLIVFLFGKRRSRRNVTV